MAKKLKGKVIDYSERGFLVLCFRYNHRETMLLEELEDYLLFVNSPYTVSQFFKEVPLKQKLEILTEAYQSNFKK